MSRLTRITATVLLAQVVLTACSYAAQDGQAPMAEPVPDVRVGDEDQEEHQAELDPDDVMLTDEPLTVTDVAVAADTTAIFDDVTRSSLLEYTSTGTLHLAEPTPQLEALRPGDVIVSRPSKAAPEGIFRKVTNISPLGTNGTSVQIETEEATLDDAFDQGDFYIELELGPDGEAIHRMVLPEGMRGADLTRELFLDWGDLEECPQPDDTHIPPSNLPGNPCVDYSDDTKLKAEDCGKSRQLAALKGQVPKTELTDGVTIAGEVELALTVCLYASISKSTFIAVVGGEQTAKVDLHAAGKFVDLKNEIKIGSAPLAKASFGVLTVRGDLELVLGVEGSIEADAKVKVHQKAAAYAGIGYKNGWHNLSHAKFDFDATVTLTGAKADLKAYAGAKPALTVALGEVCFIRCVSVAKGSVGITAKVFAEADAVPARTPFCRLHGGVAVDAFAKIRILGFIKEDLDRKLYEEKEEDIAPCDGSEDGRPEDPRLADIGDLPAELAQELDPSTVDPATLDRDALESPVRHPAIIDIAWLEQAEVVTADQPVPLDSSSDDDEADLIYEWTATLLTADGPATSVVVGDGPRLDWNPADTFPDLEGPADVEIRLTVTDSHGNVTTDVIVVTIEPTD